MIREWAARFLGMFRKRAMRDRLDLELALHQDLLAEDLSKQATSSRPRREMGSASFRDAYEDQSGVPWIENLWRDLRYALRSMCRSPAFSLIVILTFALGIGAIIGAGIFVLTGNAAAENAGPAISVSFILGGIVGIPPSLYVLLHADAAALRVGFGIFLVVYASYMLLRPTVRLFANVRGRLPDAIVGFAGGLVGGLTAMPGAPVRRSMSGAM